jgi:hypothetical protein
VALSSEWHAAADEASQPAMHTRHINAKSPRFTFAPSVNVQMRVLTRPVERHVPPSSRRRRPRPGLLVEVTDVGAGTCPCRPDHAASERGRCGGESR